MTVAVDTGYEIQIDEEARGDRRERRRTGSCITGPALFTRSRSVSRPVSRTTLTPSGSRLSVWHTYQIKVTDRTYEVLLNGKPSTTFTADPLAPNEKFRGKEKSEDPDSGFIGLQVHTGTVAFANIRVSPEPPARPCDKVLPRGSTLSWPGRFGLMPATPWAHGPRRRAASQFLITTASEVRWDRVRLVAELAWFYAGGRHVGKLASPRDSGRHRDQRHGNVRPWLPWVSAGDGNAVTVKIIHENDQFLQNVPPASFRSRTACARPMAISGRARCRSPARRRRPGSAWGTPGRYIYRYTIANPNVGTLDWIIDPCAREFGVGKLSAFTLGYQPYVVERRRGAVAHAAAVGLVLYEINIAEFGGDLERTRNVVGLSRDLGVNAVEVMPLSNVASLGRLGLSADRLLRGRRALRQAIGFPAAGRHLRISTASP